MAERGAIWMIMIAALIGLANAQFEISRFENIQDGVESKWPDDDKYSNDPYRAACSENKVWLVSRRFSQLSNRPIKPGGIVSTLHLGNNTWTHRPHTLDMSKVDFKLLSLHGRLIMLLFTPSNGIIKYGKMFSWNELQWSEIPFNPSTVKNPVGTNIHLAVTVPDQSSNIAYLAASANDGRATKAVVSKLEVNFDADSKPIDAKLNLIHRSMHDKPVSIFATPINNDSRLYVFWFDTVVKPGEILDRKTNVTRPFEIIPSNSDVQSKISIGEDEDNFFQFRGRLIVQGEDSRDRSQWEKTSDGRHIWSYDMSTDRLEDATPWYPVLARLLATPRKLVLDQKNGLIYMINFQYGVFRSKISL